MSTRSKGDRGEDIAAAYLVQNGCVIRERNYTIRGAEVDIIFSQGDTTVFCEVKLRNQDRFGTPSEAVDLRKQRRICMAALDYAAKNKTVDQKFRFDIIEIRDGKINHIKNAFDFIEPKRL